MTYCGAADPQIEESCVKDISPDDDEQQSVLGNNRIHVRRLLLLIGKIKEKDGGQNKAL